MNLFSAMDLAACVLSSYVGINNLNYFLRIRTEKARLHFSLLCFLIAAYDATVASIYASGSSSDASWHAIQYFASVAISMEVVHFTYRILSRRIDPPGRILLGTFTAFLFAGVVLTRGIVDMGAPLERTLELFGSSATYYERRPGIVWDALFAPQLLGMVYLFVLMTSELLRRRHRELLPLLAGFLVFFLSVGLDIMTASGLTSIMYTAEYSFLVLIVTMDGLLLKRFIRARKEVEAMNANLGGMVRERTAEIRKLADELIEANRELTAKNASLTELAERDSMTKLLNHEAFHHRFSELFNLSRRQAFPTCVMIIDIDHFKSINDRFGHQAGDAVIRRFAETLQTGSRDYDVKGRYAPEGSPGSPVLRDYDLAGRYGGDEFAIALPYCGAPEAEIVAERICSMIRALEFEQYPEMRVSASIGCSVISGAPSIADELRAIKVADRALYEAKERGRNGYVVRSLDEDDIELLE